MRGDWMIVQPSHLMSTLHCLNCSKLTPIWKRDPSQTCHRFDPDMIHYQWSFWFSAHLMLPHHLWRIADWRELGDLLALVWDPENLSQVRGERAAGRTHINWMTWWTSNQQFPATHLKRMMQICVTWLGLWTELWQFNKGFRFFFLSELIMNLLRGNHPNHQDGCVRLTNKIIDDIINLDFIFPESSQLIWTHLSLIISRHTWDVVEVPLFDISWSLSLSLFGLSISIIWSHPKELFASRVQRMSKFVWCSMNVVLIKTERNEMKLNLN